MFATQIKDSNTGAHFRHVVVTTVPPTSDSAQRSSQCIFT